MDALVDLPYPELLDTLQRVFARKGVFEEPWSESRFFLGIGLRQLRVMEDDEEIDEAAWGHGMSER